MGLGLLYLALVVVFIVHLERKPSESNTNPAWGGIALIAIIGLIALIAKTLMANSEIISYEENIKAFTQAQNIYQQRKDALLPQLLSELHKYPDYETDVLKTWAKNGGALVNIPPNLKASDTIMSCVTEIKEMNDSIYDNQFRIIDEKNYLNNRRRTMQLWAIYIKSIPESYHN